MACHKLNIDGGTAIVCTRERRRFCRDCGRPATKLCDFPMPPIILHGKPTTKSRTCDRPMCDRHAVSQSPTTDYCEEHDQLAKRKHIPTQQGLFE